MWEEHWVVGNVVLLRLVQSRASLSRSSAVHGPVLRQRTEGWQDFSYKEMVVRRKQRFFLKPLGSLLFQGQGEVVPKWLSKISKKGDKRLHSHNPASLGHWGSYNSLVTLALHRVHNVQAWPQSDHCTWHKSAPLALWHGGRVVWMLMGWLLKALSLAVKGPQCGSAQTGERLEWWGWPNEGWIGVGVGNMCPEWLKGGRWPMWVMWLARPGPAPKGEALSCMHLDNSSKLSPARLFLLDLLDIFRLRVWMPSFFMVRGLLTCGEQNISSRRSTQKVHLTHWWILQEMLVHVLHMHLTKVLWIKCKDMCKCF